MSASLTVVVPVYEGREQALACLRSVVRHAGGTATPFDLLVIDDASPDPDLPPALAALVADAGTGDPPMSIRLVRNPENLGFVGTVNWAFDQCAGDVILLNADTVVTAGWLDRMVEAAEADDVATVTPLSNEGSICTVPPTVIEAFGLMADDPRIDDCAAFVAAQSAGMRPEVITGVGFAMFVSRAAYDRCGPFDQDAYGRGYGEEVDFCLRAGRLGLRHVVEDSTYVHHHGAVSFGDDAHEQRRDASRFLHKRFRWFRAANRQERRRDPLAVTFAALELGLADRDPTRTHVLHLLHGPPDNIGGTEKHLNALIDALVSEFDFSILYPVESGFVLATRWWSDQGVIEHRFLLPGSVRWVSQLEDPLAGEALRTALDLFDVDVVHIQNLIGHSLTPLAVLGGFDGRVVCSIHDLFLACPHHSLLYRDEQSCGLPEDRSVCARCLPETEGLSIEHLDRQRARVAQSVDHVDHWIFASQSSADYFHRVYDLAPGAASVIEHGTTIVAARRGQPDEALIRDEPLRLAFVGRGWPKKGLGIVNRLADELADTTIEVHHFGELVGQGSAHLHQHGTYDNEALGDLLALAGIQVVLLPGSVPESFGLVLTEAILAGVPVIGTTFGALGERIRAYGVGWTVDPADSEGLVELVSRLDANRWEILRASRRAAGTAVETVAQTAPRYGALYRDGTDDREDHG
jgi:GT2 family glycosyltransferase/glycosyltransferase involved in cell wall biosynthesis